MGRSRKPVNQQKKNLKVIEIQRRRAEEEAALLGAEPLDLPPLHRFYNEFAESEYRRHLPYMIENGAFDGRDQDNLVEYCNALAHETEVIQAQKKDPSTGMKRIEMLKSTMALERLYLDQMYKFGRLCGFSPEARLKIAATKVNEEEQQLERGFGNI